MLDIEELLDESEEQARRDWFGEDDDGTEPLPFHMDQRGQFHFMLAFLVGTGVVMWLLLDWINWIGNNGPKPF